MTEPNGMKPTQIRDRAALLAAVQQGLRPKYLFFWGHQPQKDGQVDKACLSQWWPVSFTIDGQSYPSAEHYMMAEKARLFGDEAIRRQILVAGHPGEAKKLGRLVQDFDEEVWSAQCYEIVVRGNAAKFGQNEALKRFLIQTNERILVEASPYDRIWGIGLTEADTDAASVEKWQGLNLLGFALMAVRERLQE